ncbi:hypothetical protein L218DRAFT_862878, partial [Marasmius fiardii PR-910]
TGIYVVVFGLSVHILLRHDGPSNKLYIGGIISLFVLATIYTPTHAWGTSRQVTVYFKAATTKNYIPLMSYFYLDERANAWM